MAHSTQHSAEPKMSTAEQPFRLLDLPDELWVRIGKMVIDATACFDEEQLQPSSRLTPAERAARKQPAITRTCRVLRHELLPYYYTTRVLITVILPMGKSLTDAGPLQEFRQRLKRWLHAIGRNNRQMIGGFEVCDYWKCIGPKLVLDGCGIDWKTDSEWDMWRWSESRIWFS